MLTEAYRGQVDYIVQEGVSVSQSVQKDKGNLMEIDQGNLVSITARKHRLGPYLTSKDRHFQRFIGKSQSLRTPSSSRRRRAPSRTTMATKIGISRSSSTKSCRDGKMTKISKFCFRYYSKKKTHRRSELGVGTFWTSRNCKLKHFFLTMQRFFGDAESMRSGNSHVMSRPVSFPSDPTLEGMLRHSFVSPSRREGPPSIWDTHDVSGNVFARCVIISALSSRIASMEFIERRASPFVHSGEK